MTDAFSAPVPAAVTRERPRSRFADLAPPRRFPGAALGAGLVASVLLVGHRPGVGVPITLAVAAAAALPALRVERGDRVFVALLLALGVMPALRDAEWLVALDLLAILALGCLSAVGARDWHTLLVAAVSVPLRAIPAPAFLGRGLPGHRELGPALRGTAIAAALLLLFGALFASADAAFGELLGGLLPDAGLLPARLFVLALVTAGLGAAVLANRVPADVPCPPEPRRLRGVEWLVPLVSLDLLFAAFVAVQLAVLFGGHSHVLETAGLTYAEYARSGFFQLIVVTALTFGVVAGAVRWAPPGRLSRALIGTLLLLDGVVLVSAIRRLALYESVFGLSVDRVLAHTIAFWLAAVLVMVVVAGLTRRAAWLPRAVAASAGGALLLLNVANPDALIARSLLDRYERTGDIDTYYLGGLSADVVPEVAKLPDALRACVFQHLDVEDDPWPAANVSRARARGILADATYPAYGVQGCGLPVAPVRP